MGDGKIKKIAVVIAGSSEQWLGFHLATTALKKQGYDVYCAGLRPPLIEPTKYERATPKGIEALLSEVRKKIDDDDELVISVQSHGESEYLFDNNYKGSLYLKQSQEQWISSDHPIFAALSSLSHGKRTVVWSTCQSGAFASMFTRDPRTLFISSAMAFNDSYRSFGWDFWERMEKIPDYDHDGTRSYQDRFRYALKNTIERYPEDDLRALYLRGRDYEDTGLEGSVVEKPHFAPRVHEARTVSDYERLIGTLKPGDVAVVHLLPSMKDECADCEAYEREFREMAAGAKGNELFISIPNGDRFEWRWKEIESYPAILVVNDRKEMVVVKDRHHPLSEQWRLSAERIPGEYVRLKRQPRGLNVALGFGPASASVYANRDERVDLRESSGTSIRLSASYMKPLVKFGVGPTLDLGATFGQSKDEEDTKHFSVVSAALGFGAEYRSATNVALGAGIFGGAAFLNHESVLPMGGYSVYLQYLLAGESPKGGLRLSTDHFVTTTHEQVRSLNMGFATSF